MSSINTLKFWEQSYEQKRTPWDLGQISEPLKEYIDQLTDKNLKILIPGMGNGYEVEYLFKKGFKNVYGLDFSAKSLRNFSERVQDFPPKQLLMKDFFTLNDSFDLILEQTFFCALPISLRENYAFKMHQLLKPNGKLVGVLFDRGFHNEGPPFGGSYVEYQNLFSSIFVIDKMEACRNSIKPRKELFISFQPKKIMDKKIILTSEQINHITTRIAYQIYETFVEEKEIVLAGILNSGYVFTQKIAKALEEISDLKVLLCKVEVNKQHPIDEIKTSLQPQEYTNKCIVLIDDVMQSGGTLIYSVSHFLKVPVKKFKTAVLIDRNHKNYPVKADFKGISLSTSTLEHVQVVFNQNEQYAYLS